MHTLKRKCFPQNFLYLTIEITPLVIFSLKKKKKVLSPFLPLQEIELLPPGSSAGRGMDSCLGPCQPPWRPAFFPWIKSAAWAPNLKLELYVKSHFLLLEYLVLG